MKKIAFLMVTLLGTLTLSSCVVDDKPDNNKPTPQEPPIVVEEKTFIEKFNTLKTTRMTLTGKETISFYDTDGQVGNTAESTVTTKFGDKSYHILIDGDAEELKSTVFTEDKDKVLHCYIKPDNTIGKEEIKDKNDVPYSWKDFQNPFLELDGNLFIEGENDLYNLDFSKEENKSIAVELVSSLTYHTFVNPADNASFIENVSLKCDKNAVTDVIINTTKITDTFGTSSYTFELKIDTSLETIHDTPLPDPLPTKEYHKTLKNALSTTFNTLHKVVVSEDFQDGMEPFVYENTIVPNKGFNLLDKFSGDNFAFVQLKDGVHEVIFEGELVSYNPSVLTSKDGANVSSLNELVEFLTVAVEWIQFNDETKTYTLEGSTAGAFGYGLSPASIFDPQIYASTLMELKLTEDNSKLASATFSGGGCLITLTYTYDGVTFPFNLETIEAHNPIKTFIGIYKFKINEIEHTIVVSPDGTLTFDNTKIDKTSFNKYGELEFVYEDISYSISLSKKKIYNNTTAEAYAFTKVE